MHHITISIGFAPDLVPLIQNGSKTLTYRIGDKFNSLQVGDTIAIRDSSTNTLFADVVITQREQTTFKDVPIDRVGHEKYESKEKQKEIFKNYYGTVHDEDSILVLGFRVTKEY